jgi:hypothetical protein
MDGVSLEILEEYAGNDKYRQESSYEQRQCVPERVDWK